jgi:hypothetical protein
MSLTDTMIPQRDLTKFRTYCGMTPKSQNLGITETLQIHPLLHNEEHQTQTATYANNIQSLTAIYAYNS